MSRRDKIGLMVLILLFALFCLVLVFTQDQPNGATRSFEDNAIVEQRILNLQQNR